MGEYCLWLKSFPSAVYERVDSYLQGGFIPSYKEKVNNNFATFDVALNDNSFDDTLTIKTGDDMVVTTDSTAIAVKDDGVCGKVSEYTWTANVFEEPDEITGVSRKLCTHQMTMEQRDFSGLPFEINEPGIINLSALLPLIFQEHTRSDLGGTINSVVIPKYVLLCPDRELPNYIFTGGAKEHTIEAINNRLGLKWYIMAYCEPSGTNGLNLAYQVAIDE